MQLSQLIKALVDIEKEHGGDAEIAVNHLNYYRPGTDPISATYSKHHNVVTDKDVEYVLVQHGTNMP